MIKRLRRKLIALTTVLLTVVLVVILGFIYHFTRMGLVESSMTALQTAGVELGIHGRPGKPNRLTTSPAFCWS